MPRIQGLTFPRLEGESKRPSALCESADSVGGSGRFRLMRKESPHQEGYSLPLGLVKKSSAYSNDSPLKGGVNFKSPRCDQTQPNQARSFFRNSLGGGSVATEKTPPPARLLYASSGCRAFFEEKSPTLKGGVNLLSKERVDYERLESGERKFSATRGEWSPLLRMNQPRELSPTPPLRRRFAGLIHEGDGFMLVDVFRMRL